MTTLVGAARLVRLVLRLDRLRLPIWVFGLIVFIVVSAASLVPLYPDQASIETYARLFGDNPALVAFAGPGYGFDDPNIGVILVNETQLWGCLAVALMSIFLVNRHTRADEDVERAEVLRSSVVGRHAPAFAAMFVVGAANLVVAGACAVGFIVLDYPVAGSLALAGSFAGAGLVFTGMAGVCAQIAGSGRGTLGMASGLLTVFFILRALGDIGENGLRWLSPIGWAQGVRAYAGERWWLLGVCLVTALALGVLAFWLSTKRDLGSGLLPQKPGAPGAEPWLRSPLGVAVRLQRGFVLGWMVGAVFLGLAYGSIGEDIEAMIADNPAYADIMAQLQGASLADSYLATSINALAMVAAGFAVAAVLRLHTEEAGGRAEPVLSAAVSRARWITSHVLVAIGGSTLVMTAAGVGVGGAYALVTGDGWQLPRLVGSALVTVPAVLVLGALALIFFGWLPRFAVPLTWTVYTVVVLIGFFAELLNLPAWSRNLSPLSHVPAVPARPVVVLPLLLLLLVAAGLAAVGLDGFRRRDLRTE